MSVIDEKAFESVGRAFGFCALGIGCVGMGLSFDPVMATKTTAILTTLLALALIAFGERARYKSVRDTETWVLLEKADRPQGDAAQKIIGAAIRRAFLRFALLASALAIGLWVATLVFEFFSVS